MACTCTICCEDTKKSKMLACPKCNIEVCHSCIVNYAKTHKGEMICMACKKLWERSFIFQALPPSIVYGDLKVQRESMLIENEVILIPATQQLFQLMKYEKTIEEKNKKLAAKKHALDIKYSDVKVKQIRLRNQIDGHVAFTDINTEVIPKAQVICPCPGTDCRGFIMNGTKYSCGVCDSKICKDCHVLLPPHVDDGAGGADAHVCNPDDVESVKLIIKECKPCPGCGVPSRKTEGCSQVWCISCHKAWNWNTGEIEKGRIHATDYLNYLRREGQNIPRFDQPNNGCYGVSIRTAINKVKSTVLNTSSVLTHEVEEFLTKRYQIMAEYEMELDSRVTKMSNTDLRLKYLQKDIDETKWKQELHKRDKEYIVKMEIHRIRCAYTVSIRDAITQMSYSKTLDELKENVDAIYNLHKFMVMEYKNLMKKFNSKRKCPFLRMNEIAW